MKNKKVSWLFLVKRRKKKFRHWRVNVYSVGSKKDIAWSSPVLWLYILDHQPPCHIWKNKQSSGITLPHLKKQTIIRNRLATSEKNKQSSGITLPHLKNKQSSGITLPHLKKQTTIRNHLTTSEKTIILPHLKKQSSYHIWKKNNYQESPYHIWKNKQPPEITLPHLKKTNNHQESPYHIWKNKHQKSSYNIWKNKQSSGITLPHLKKQTIIRNHFTTSKKKTIIRNHLTTSEKTNNHQKSLYHIWKNKQSSEITLLHLKKQTTIRNHLATSEKTIIRNHFTISEKKKTIIKNWIRRIPRRQDLNRLVSFLF